MSTWIYMPPIDMEWESDSKIKSLDNVGYAPSGGNKPIESHVLKWRAEAKVSSLDEKHMAQVDKYQSAPKKDHVRRIKIPPTIPASNFKKVEYTRNGVYAIVEPVKYSGKSKINFPKQNFEEKKPSENIDITRRIKLTKNTRVDNYKHVEETDDGIYAMVEPNRRIEAKSKVDFPKTNIVSEKKPSEYIDVRRRVKLTKNTRLDNYKNVEHTDDGIYAMVEPVGRKEVKSKVNFPKAEPVSERKSSENVNVKRRIKLTKNTRVENYKHVEQTEDGLYAMVDPVQRIEAKSKVDFPKAEPVSERKPSENIDVTRRIKLTKNSRVDNYTRVEQTDEGTYAVVDPVGKIDAKPKVDFPKPEPVSERKPSENIDVTRRIKLTKNSRVDNYTRVEQTDEGTYAVVDPVGKIDAKPKVDFPKPPKSSKRRPDVDNIEHKYRFF